MKTSRLIAAALAGGALLALCGCADNGGSSSESEATTAAAVQQTTKQTSFTTEDGMFTLELNDRFSKFEGIYPADFEFLFVDNESDTTVGILEMSELHITPKYYCETIKSHYEELYGTVTGTEADENGLPAYLLEATFTDEGDEANGEYRFYHKAIGYGNGDLFVLVVTVPKDKPEDAPKAVSDIMAGLTYLGEPLKTDTEVHEAEFFTVSADKNWYYHSKSDTEATLRPNIAETLPEHYGSLKITGEKAGKTAQALSAEDAEEFEAKEKISEVEVTEGVKCLGRDAVCVSCVLNSDYIDLKREIYYFDESGVNFKVQILAPVEGYDDFTAELGEVYDTIVIK